MQDTVKTKANLEWRDGMPYSTAFGDVYFSSDNGQLETEYVFLQGNDLQSRWQALDSSTFTIIETGFGTGLNFLCAASLWLQSAPADAHLIFISVEKYPLTQQELTLALQHWPALKPVAETLLSQYASLLNTGSISLFNNRIQLDVLFGDATTCLSTIHTKADAWFLDGFAPSKNPEMWQDALFAQMARLSHAGSTFATFTSAGAVRRGLTAAGFTTSKRTGFGKKREMLHGHYPGSPAEAVPHG